MQGNSTQINQIKRTESTVNNVKQGNSQISVKCLETKFMGYVNKLNSSIVIAKKKTLKSKKGGEDSDYSSDYVNETYDSFNSIEMNSSKTSDRSSKDRKRIHSPRYKLLEGFIFNGQSKGQVVLQYQNGSKFTGIVQSHKPRTGIFSLKSGVKYKGTFKHQLLHGFGSLFLPNGTEYRAVFKNGLIDDKAQIIYENGDVYNGQILKYKKHGKGQLKFQNGDKYIGEFFQGDIYGKGKFYRNQELLAEGIWKNGEFVKSIQDKNVSHSHSQSSIDQIIEDSRRS